MFNVLTPYGIPEISIITGLSVAAIILITLNIVLIVRATRKPTGQDGQVTYVPVPVPAPVEEAAEEPQPEPEVAAITDTTPEQGELWDRLRLNRSFTAKLIQTDEETKQLYAELKRELLCYSVHARMSWRRETYSKSREALARFGVRGKTLCLYLALRPEDFAGSKYKAEDASSNHSFEDTPLMYRIKNPLRMRYAKELIAYLMAQRGLEKGEYVGGDPMDGLEYRSTPALIDEGLIRVPAGMELPVFTEPAPVAEEPIPAPVEEAAEEPEPEVVAITDTTPEQGELWDRLRLNRSFTAKLIQTDEETKQLYAELKRELLCYSGVHARMSWRRETYSKSREALARFGVRGKTLCLYLALQPEDFAGSKYKAEDASSNHSFEDTPLMYRIKNPLRMRYAKELIAYLMAQRGLEKGEYVGGDPMDGLEYRSTPALIDEGLIRVPAGMELPVFTEPAPVEEAAEEPIPEPEVAAITDTTPEQGELWDRLRLNRSFTAKLIQTDEETKQLYAELKRELLCYSVHARMSWRRETYSKSREALARFGVRGKTLCLYLALRPEDFAGSKYKAEDASSNHSFEDTPLMYRIKNPLRMRYAKELIAYLMAQRGLEKGEYVGGDPMDGLEYRSTPALIDEGLIRVPAGMELPVFTEPVPVAEEPVLAPVGEAAEEPQPEPMEEVAEAVSDEPVEEAETESAEVAVVEERAAEELQPEAEAEIAATEAVATELESAPKPVEEVAGEVSEEPTEEAVEEVPDKPIEEVAEEVPQEPVEKVAEEVAAEREADAVPEEVETPPEHCIPVVGVVFRRRLNKIYWFDPDGKEWKKNEVAVFTTPDGVCMEVIVVVEETERAESLLHLPLKPLQKLHS